MVDEEFAEKWETVLHKKMEKVKSMDITGNNLSQTSIISHDVFEMRVSFHLLDYASDKVVADIIGKAETVNYPEGIIKIKINFLETKVIEEGDQVTHVYFLEKGIVKQKILNRSHNFPGNIFNLTAICLEPVKPVVIFDLVTVSKCKFKKVPVGKLTIVLSDRHYSESNER